MLHTRIDENQRITTAYLFDVLPAASKPVLALFGESTALSTIVGDFTWCSAMGEVAAALASMSRCRTEPSEARATGSLRSLFDAAGAAVRAGFTGAVAGADTATVGALMLMFFAVVAIVAVRGDCGPVTVGVDTSAASTATAFDDAAGDSATTLTCGSVFASVVWCDESAPSISFVMGCVCLLAFALHC